MSCSLFNQGRAPWLRVRLQAMILPPFDSLQAQHDASLRLMRFQWLDPARHYLRSALVHGRNLRPALLHGRDLVIAYKPAHVLIDFDGLPPISLQDELWMSVNWFPQVVAQPLEQVALVLRAEHLHNQMAVETMLWVGRNLLRFQVQVFEDVPVALDWLAGGNAAEARRLQDEWDAALPPPPGATLPT